MSSDTIFAAQFWLWPDPAMKRDAQGRIIFINAAFLQLYGGSVEAWTGNVLQGWPAPQAVQPGAYPTTYRFETRMPSSDPSLAEQVLDWIEQTSPDGTAFAIARNVTDILLAQMPAQTLMRTASADAPTESKTLTDAQPQLQQNNVADAVSAIQQEAMARLEDTQPTAAYSPHHAEAQPVQEHATAQYTPEQLPQTAPPQALDVSAQHDKAPPNQATQNTAPPQAAPQQSISSQPAPQSNTAQQQAAQQEERDFERRALPLESNSAILGNNWRDAVIAKAVGAELEATPVDIPAPVEEPETSGGTGKHILLAEDNAINALLTRTLLEAEGHTVETVEDGALAVEAMKTQSFDLIFMDMRMPNMDGLESTRKIRQLPNVPRSLPIIALTANAFDDDRNACFDSGMNDFMTKPVSAEELSEMVVTWTDPEKMKAAS